MPVLLLITRSCSGFMSYKKFMPFDDIYRKLQLLDSFDIKKECIDIIQQNSGLLKSMLRKQLASGKDAFGEPVTLKRRGGVFDFYSDRTIWEKEFHGVGLGRVTDVITHYMSGQFYATLVLKTKGDEFSFESPLYYYQDILARSGTTIMDLNAEDLNYFSTQILIPEIQRRFTEAFNGV